jgi:hypothetical protein
MTADVHHLNLAMALELSHLVGGIELLDLNLSHCGSFLLPEVTLSPAAARGKRRG